MIGQTRVPYEGPDEYDILIVGEAPGGEEAGQGRPFVGKSGQLLERYLERHLISRGDVKLANLSKRRPGVSPVSNRFELLLGTDELEEDLADLEAEIKRAKPNVIIALGGWPMYYLTGNCGKEHQKDKPGSGILTYRGSRYHALPRWGEEQKVICTFHPSYILRNWKWNPFWFIDLYSAIEDSKFPELRLPEYEEYIDPDPDVLHDLVHQTQLADWASVDIETFSGGKFSCVGWAFRYEGVMKGVCITYNRPDLDRFAKEVWECDVPKIFQYGTYDGPFMRNFYSWKLGGYYNKVGWDTYVASASIYPDYPRSLSFLVSVHTRMPYYKEDRKVWREKGDMNILWKYNIKDTVGTHLVAEDQMEIMGELYG